VREIKTGGNFGPRARAQATSLKVSRHPTAILSIVETCRPLKIPICDYLASILPGLAELPLNRVDQLTPAAWLAAN
jgi:hypothetical protein